MGKTDEKNPVGRPPIYSDVDGLERNILAYFSECDLTEPKRPYTVPGLAYFLGFESRHSIQDYKDNPKFSPTIKKALGRIETQRVENLVNGRGSAPGCIFDLKNNFGYQDKQEIGLSGSVVTEIEIHIVDPK